MTWCEVTLLIVGVVEAILIGTAIILFAEYVNKYKKLKKELEKYKRRRPRKKKK